MNNDHPYISEVIDVKGPVSRRSSTMAVSEVSINDAIVVANEKMESIDRSEDSPKALMLSCSLNMYSWAIDIHAT